MATLTGQFATAFPITLFSVVLAPIAHSYGVSTSFLTWAITGPFLVQAVCTPVFGKLGDIFGQRRLFLMGLAGSVVAALATAGAPTAAALIGLRIAGQVCGAACQPSALALIMRVHPPDQRMKATGWWSMVSAGAPVTGLIIGGPLADAFGWRSLFIVQAGITAAALLLAMRILPADRRTYRTPVDSLGACLLMAGLLGILFPINQLPASGLSIPLAVIFAAGVVLLAIFARRELRIAHPLIQMSFFTTPTFCLAIGIGSCMMFGYFGSFVLTPIYLETALGVTLSLTSLIMTGRPFSMSVSSPFWVRLPGNWPRRGPIFGGLFVVLSMCVFAFGAWNHLLVAFIVGNILSGLAVGVANPGLTARLISSVAPEDYGSAAGVQVMFTQIASVLGLSVLVGVATRGGTSVHGPSYALAYLIGAAVAIGAIVLAAYLNIRVPETRPQARHQLATQDG
jgi:MFS family permease